MRNALHEERSPWRLDGLQPGPGSQALQLMAVTSARLSELFPPGVVLTRRASLLQR